MRTIYAAALLALAGLAGAASAEKPAETAKAATVKVAARPAEKAYSDQREPSQRVAAQVEAMKALAFLDGEWRGVSKTKRREGWEQMVQTERVTTLLGGAVKQIEVRGYESDGTLSFQALRIVSYDPQSKTYVMRSYQGGGVRDHKLDVRGDGFSWEVGAKGRSAVRYDAMVRNGVWSEKATRLSGSGDPETYFEFTVRRAKAGVWPAVAALAAK